ILIAPVVENGAKARRVYLPAGTWFDWWTGEKSDGGHWIERAVDLATMPIYVRAGAILPLDPVPKFTSQAVAQPTTLRIFPGADGAFTLYDDDGQTLRYRNVMDATMIWIRFRWNDSARRLTADLDDRMARWPRESRVFMAEVVGSDARPRR